jgi:hypothetical protein
MTPTEADSRLKSMTAWTVDPTLSQTDITTLLTAASRADTAGHPPSDPNWAPTYALYWAAREAWAWKAGACSDHYKVVGDGTELERNQVFQHCERMFALYDKMAAASASFGGFGNVRSQGGTLVDRLGLYTAIPWWWEVSGN